ncbi:hypothetical protein NO2_1494 [Candidatus Termititenax persephonae]|uniref:Uncharacterized protein n=1 Tax=Candidatus Termititenax persephonae TaxID=2218525 RepID=A0A388TIJ1_9BACT|nr:hypothetical protein NO2_1494 [Candidatus Termititenax persephonae]
MVLPMAATPILEGEDARFYKEMAENKKNGRSDEEFNRITNNARELAEVN